MSTNVTSKKRRKKIAFKESFLSALLKITLFTKQSRGEEGVWDRSGIFPYTVASIMRQACLNSWNLKSAQFKRHSLFSSAPAAAGRRRGPERESWDKLQYCTGYNEPRRHKHTHEYKPPSLQHTNVQFISTGAQIALPKQLWCQSFLGGSYLKYLSVH